MSIDTVEVPIGTLQVDSVGTPQCSAQFLLLVYFGLFFGHFSELGIVFGCILNLYS